MNVVIQPKHMSQNTGNIMGLVHHIKLNSWDTKGTFFLPALNKPFVQGFRA